MQKIFQEIQDFKILTRNTAIWENFDMWEVRVLLYTYIYIYIYIYMGYEYVTMHKVITIMSCTSY